MKKIIATIIVILVMTAFAGTVLAKTGTVNTQGLNLRDGATTVDTNILKKLDKGVTVNIIEELNGWYKIIYEDFEGYVNQDFIDVNTETVTPEEPATGTTTQPVEEQDAKMISDADVYILPIISSTKISEVSNGTKVDIISETANWKYIQTPSVCGWVFANKVDGHKLDKSQEQENNVDDNTLVENKVEENEVEQSEVTENKVEENQVVENKVVDNNQNEVSSSENNSVPTSYPVTMYVNVDAVNIRENASIDADVVTSVGLNTPVTVKAVEGDWYKVEVSDGKGYMKKEYLSATRTE